MRYRVEIPLAVMLASESKRRATMLGKKEPFSGYSRPIGPVKEEAYVLRVAAAQRLYGDAATLSIASELTSVHKKGVMSQVRVSTLSPAQLSSVIRSSMFLKEKFFPDGDFDKLKSRFVAGGDRQDRAAYTETETSSPTVSLQSLYMTAAIAARERRKVGTMDVGNAFLNADMVKEVLMRIEPRTAKILCGIEPGAYQQEADGTIVVRLNKALYGCLESAKLWYDNLTKKLKSLGFVENAKDPCVLNMMRGGHQVTVNVYVDDILCTSIDEADIAWLGDELKREYGVLTVNLGVKHSYLGQTFDFSVVGRVKATMSGYIRDCLESCSTQGTRATPATNGLFEVDDASPLLSKERAQEFHSRTARLLYLAHRARPDILTAVAFLTTRVHKSTEEDWAKLDRVLMYLNGCPDLGLTLCVGSEFKLLTYVDASFAVHADMKSHTGAFMTLGKGPIFVSSKKQKLMTKSSTESELVGMSDVLPMAIWARDFLIEQGYKMEPATLFQDNQSTIILAEKGQARSARTRHIAIKYFFVKDRIESHEVEVKYIGTDEMIADIMTKPLQGDKFRQMRAWLLGLDE